MNISIIILWFRENVDLFHSLSEAERTKKKNFEVHRKFIYKIFEWTRNSTSKASEAEERRKELKESPDLIIFHSVHVGVRGKSLIDC